MKGLALYTELWFERHIIQSQKIDSKELGLEKISKIEQASHVCGGRKCCTTRMTLIVKICAGLTGDVGEAISVTRLIF